MTRITFLLIGLVFAARPAAAQWQFETLKTFAGGAEGFSPAGPMVEGADGWIYGLTQGNGDCATAFRFDPVDPAGTFQTVWGPNCPAYVGTGGVVRAPDANLYFMTTDGGYCPSAVIWRWTPPATMTALHAIGGQACVLTHGVSVGLDGALYVAVAAGGANGTGGIYRVGLNGSFSEVGSFPTVPFAVFDIGGRELTPPIQGSDGRFYGTQTVWQNAIRTISTRTFVYRLDPGTGSTIVLHDFPPAWPDGAAIRGRLLEVPPTPGNDIAIAGATMFGGSYGAGVVFRIDVAGDTPTFTKPLQFNASVAPYLGETPLAGLIRDESDGALYGTTFGYFPGWGPGTPSPCELGTIYRIDASGATSKLYGDAIIHPAAPLLLASDGNLYGTSVRNSGNGCLPTTSLGSIFRLSRATQDSLSVTGAPGSAPYATSFTVGTTGGSGTGAVTFSASGACSNVNGGALITMTSGTGSCSITATKAGDANYRPITSAPVSVTAVKVTQTVIFGELADKTLGDPPFTVSATGGASGNPVTFTTTPPSICTSAGVNGETITLVATGTCTVRASQAGDANYEAAEDVDRSFEIQGGGDLMFAGLFSPWAPPGPGTYNGTTFTSGTAYKMNSVLPVKWGYSINGILVDSSRSAVEQYPVVNIQGPLAACDTIDGTGTDTVVSFSGPGGTTTATYDSLTKTWQRNIKLESPLEADKCYVIQVFDPVSGTTSPSFPFKTRK